MGNKRGTSKSRNIVANLHDELNKLPNETSGPTREKPPQAVPRNEASDQADKKRDKPAQKANIGSKRGVETMLRSAYRTNLELNALADNKANMLISVNGLILSVMIATGGLSVFFSAAFWYVIPMVALAATSFGAMVFAIMVARPRVDFSWIPTTEQFHQDQANPFLFMHFHALSQDEYIEVINEVMQDRERLYRHMITHNYGMGVILARKFKLLRWSYNVFMAGLGLTLALFIGVHSFAGDKAAVVTAAGTAASDSSFLPMPGVYEPSAILALEGNRTLVVEDEAGQSLKLVEFHEHGRMTLSPVSPSDNLTKQAPDFAIDRLEDLEGMDGDRQGNIYLITSHSRRTVDGKLHPDRNRFIRMRLEADRITGISQEVSLLTQLAEAYPELAPALAETDVKRRNGFNIEGLALNAAQDQLLIGLRSPLRDSDKNAYIAQLENPDAVFSVGAPMRFAAELITLDLAGGGIRDLRYIPKLGAYLIISGRANAVKVPFRLWIWQGHKDSTPKEVTIEGAPSLEKAEGISTIVLNGVEKLVIVSDDGTGNIPAQYLLVDYAQLRY